MPADKVQQVFGPRGDPAVTEDLPYQFHSGKCIVLLYCTVSPNGKFLEKRIWDVPPTCSVPADLMCLHSTIYGKPQPLCFLFAYGIGRPVVSGALVCFQARVKHGESFCHAY